jgi:hypothetical protein
MNPGDALVSDKTPEHGRPMGGRQAARLLQRWLSFRYVVPLVGALLAAAFLSAASLVLSGNIGVFRDELWDFIPAVGLMRGQSVAVAQEVSIMGRPVPLVAGPYQGALKAWLSAPLLAMVGTSPGAIYALNVLFSIGYLAALYWAVAPVVGPLWAALVFAAPFIDSNFLLTGPMDAGPSLFQYLFISLALGSLFRHLSSRAGLKYYWLGWFFTGCLMAQKLTAAPVALAFSAVLIVVSLRQAGPARRSIGAAAALRRCLWVPALLVLMPLLPNLAYFLRSGLADLKTMSAHPEHSSYLETLSRGALFVSNMFDGTDWCRRIISSFPGNESRIFMWAGLAVAACAVLFSLRRRTGGAGRDALAACLGLTIVSFALYPLFPGLERPWHFYVLTPLLLCAFLLSLRRCFDFCVELPGRAVGAARAVLLLGLAAAITLGSMHGTSLLGRIRESKGACVMSPALYDTCREVERLHLRHIYAINYSLAESLYVLLGGEVRTETLAWTELTRDRLSELIRKVKSDPSTAIAFRYCGSDEEDPGYVKWLNHDPECQVLFKMLEGEDLRIVRHADARRTEFGLIVCASPR